MHTHDFLLYRQRPLVRKAGVLLAFIAAVILHYYLSHLPVAVDVAEFSPVKAGLGRELVIVDPDVAEGLILAYEGEVNEDVDARFEGVRLAPETIAKLKMLRLEPPSDVDRVHFITASGKSGRTFMKVRLYRASGASTRLHLFQLLEPGGDPYFEVKAQGAELAVEMATVDPPSDGGAPGSQKTLKVGKWEHTLSGPVPIKVIVADGSNFRFRFMSPGGGSWGEDGLFGRFTFGPSLIKLGEPPGIRARAVGIKRIEDGTTFDLFACGTRRKRLILGSGDLNAGQCPKINALPLLRVSDFKVGADGVQVNVSGKGWVQKEGNPATADLVARLKENSLVAGLVGAFDAAMVALVLRVLLSKQKS